MVILKRELSDSLIGAPERGQTSGRKCSLHEFSAISAATPLHWLYSAISDATAMLLRRDLQRAYFIRRSARPGSQFGCLVKEQ
jgi:hypothetical protein